MLMTVTDCGWCGTPRATPNGVPICGHCDRACYINGCSRCRRADMRRDLRTTR